MKKGFSLFLTLVMLLTLLPTAAFALEEAEEAPAEEAAVQIQEQQEPEAEPPPDVGPDLFFEELAEEPLLLDAGTGTGKKAYKYFNQQFHIIIFLKYSNILTLCNR